MDADKQTVRGKARSGGARTTKMAWKWNEDDRNAKGQSGFDEAPMTGNGGQMDGTGPWANGA